MNPSGSKLLWNALRLLTLAVTVAALQCAAFAADKAPDAGREKAPPMHPKSMKGWELYARHDADAKTWTFGLRRGTNWVPPKQVIDQTLTIEGLDALKAELARLHEGDTVILPANLSAGLRKQILEQCRKLKLETIEGGMPQ